MQDQLIADEGTLKHWRTELPNIIDDLGLDPFERTLYVHYKKVCGANNKSCEEGIRKTAEKTKMSTAKVSLVRRELARRGLITEHEQPKQDDQIKPQVYVTIIDIWEMNFFYYSFKEGRPNVAGWTIAQVKGWIDSVYVVNADAARLPGKRERLPGKRKEGLERLPGKQKKEPPLRINHEGTEGAAQKPPPPTRSASYLPDAETQLSVLFPGAGQNHHAAIQQIERHGWRIRDPNHLQAMAAWLEASGLPVPNRKTDRGDWISSVDDHLKTYGLEALEDLYPRIVAHMRGDGLTVSRPGSVTGNMADYWAKNKNGGTHVHHRPSRVPGRLPEYSVADPADWYSDDERRRIDAELEAQHGP